LEITEPGTWQTLTADFSSQAAASHTRVCLFPNAGVGQTTEDRYYLDNLRWEMSSGIFQPTVATLEVSPNPVSTILYARNPGYVATLRLMNALGQQVLSQEGLGEGVIPVMMGHLNPGMYLLSAYDSEGKLV